jgi:hypothetical protein
VAAARLGNQPTTRVERGAAAPRQATAPARPPAWWCDGCARDGKLASERPAKLASERPATRRMQARVRNQGPQCTYPLGEHS